LPLGDLFAVGADPRRRLVADGWAAAWEPVVEAAFALVNGYLGTQATAADGPTGIELLARRRHADQQRCATDGVGVLDVA
jgi:hypothetical protein